MLQKINWDTFKVKNENQTKSFEDLCYHLFCREHNLSNGIKADFNQAGLETYPIKSNKTNKIIGFQAKFFEPSISYSQIEKSIKKALSNYKKAKLKEIHIYLNVNAVLSSKGAEGIEKIAKNEGVSIIWITKSNFEILLNQPRNFDLAQLYFGIGNEFGFIKNSIKKGEITFINSKEFLKLPLADFNGKNVEVDLNLYKTFLITGNPGSGKSQLIKQLFVKYSGLDLAQDDFKALIKNGALPMIVNLKDCFSDSLENIIRNRQKDYKIRHNLKFIYLLDGLDELSEEKAEQAICYIKDLESRSNTKNIIISCRKGNLNRLKAIAHLPDIIKYEVNDLDHSYISLYFKNKNNSEKKKEFKKLLLSNKELIEEIKDVYLIKIFWDIIEELNSKSTIIELIKYKINELVNDPNHRNEIQTLNLLNPKEQEILILNEKIAYKFSKLYQFRFNQKELQNFLLKKFPRLDYCSINDIINYNSSLFFDISANDLNVKNSFVYQHRRYQEYFYARKLKKKYEINPNILREKDILINSDFFNDIFLRYLRSEYEKDVEKNLPFLLELNLINVYSGKSEKYFSDEPYFQESKYFVSTLSLQNANIFEELINDESLDLERYIHFSYNEVQLFFEKGHEEFALKILSQIDSDNEYEIGLVEVKGLFFVMFQMQNDNYAEYFKKDLRKKYKSYSDSKDYMNDDQSDRELILKSFFEIGLKYRPNDFLEILKVFTNYELEVFLSLLTDVENLNIFLTNEVLKTEIRKKVVSYKVAPKHDNVAVYFLKKFFDIGISSNNILKISNILESLSGRISLYFFKRFLKSVSLLSYILDENIFFGILSSKDNYRAQDAIRIYCFIFGKFVDSIKGSSNIEISINEFIIRFKKWGDLDENSVESISILWSNFYISFAKGKEKILLNYIFKIDKGLFSRYYFFKQLNEITDGFWKIISEEDIQEIEEGLYDWKDDYPKFVERCLIFSGFYSSLNQMKSMFYLKQAILSSLIRHGWRKDGIVSYYLNTSFDRIMTRNWKSKKEVIELSKSIFQLNLRLYEITDLKETRWGISNFIITISNFDLELGKKYLKKFRKEHYDHSMVINNCVKNILIIEIKNNFISLESIKKQVCELSTMRNYEGVVSDSYYRDLFDIYIEVLNSNFYSEDDKKIAFDFAYEQITLIKRKRNHESLNFSPQLTSNFNSLCINYNKEIIISNIDEVNENYQYEIISEEDLILWINNSETKEDLEKIYEKMKNSLQFRIELKNIDSWKLLIDKTYFLDSSLKMFIDLLKSLYYLDFGSGYSYNANYLHLGIAYSFSQQNYKHEILEYYSKESGHSGFYNSILIYEQIDNKEMTVKLFDRFHKFCNFLVN